MSNFDSRIDFEESWNYVQKRIKKLQDNLEGLPDTYLTSEDYMMLYTNIYNMCGDDYYCAKVYEKYKEVFPEYFNSTVFPSLQGKKDELFLRELLRRWCNHKTMTNRLSRIFMYLDTIYIPKCRLTSLKNISFLSFYHLVCERFDRQVMDAIFAMIDHKLAGETIDETLINNILAAYSEIGEITDRMEPKEFAETMMKKVNATF